MGQLVRLGERQLNRLIAVRGGGPWLGWLGLGSLRLGWTRLGWLRAGRLRPLRLGP
ncbi:hypothetical protein ACWDSL_09130 [Streptomyces sp. NPDC000941]